MASFDTPATTTIPINGNSSATATMTSMPTQPFVVPQARVPLPIMYTKPFPDVSNIEVFVEQNFKRWQERAYFLFDLHGVADALTEPKPLPTIDSKVQEVWIYANKVCRHTILQTIYI
jgi:hypothetical protein